MVHMLKSLPYKPYQYKSHTHTKHVRKYRGIVYASSISQRIYSALIAPAILLAIIGFLYIVAPSSHDLSRVSWQGLGVAMGYSFGRLAIAYVISLVLAVPLALLANSGPLAERILLPIFDIVESVPVLVFFPAIIALFVALGATNGAAIFIIFVSMLWNIVFPVAGGLRIIPGDIKAAAHVFNIRGFAYLRRVLLPATFPYLVTGSLLAWAQGWNIIIVAEVLHTYIPNGTESQDLPGIGTVLVHAATHANSSVFAASLIIVVTVIAAMNLFIWQTLLKKSEKYRFE